MHQIIVDTLGPATRDIGFGVSIQLWELEYGNLIFSLGAVKFLTPAGETIWLLETRNEALANLTGSWELNTLPDPNNRGTMYWLGTLRLLPAGRYEVNRNPRQPGSPNFFTLNSSGRFEIAFAPGVRAATLLETLPDKARMCDIVFFPDSGAAPATFAVTLDAAERTLALSAGAPFRLRKPWNKWR